MCRSGGVAGALGRCALEVSQVTVIYPVHHDNTVVVLCSVGVLYVNWFPFSVH